MVVVRMKSPARVGAKCLDGTTSFSKRFVEPTSIKTDFFLMLVGLGRLQGLETLCVGYNDLNGATN